jgi:hypothetical protein
MPTRSMLSASVQWVPSLQQAHARCRQLFVYDQDCGWVKESRFAWAGLIVCWTLMVNAAQAPGAFEWQHHAAHKLPPG